MSLKIALLHIYGVRSIYNIVNVCKSTGNKTFQEQFKVKRKGFYISDKLSFIFITLKSDGLALSKPDKLIRQ